MSDASKRFKPIEEGVSVGSNLVPPKLGTWSPPPPYSVDPLDWSGSDVAPTEEDDPSDGLTLKRARPDPVQRRILLWPTKLEWEDEDLASG